MNRYTPQEIERFKRDAKRCERDSGSLHSQALDRIAADHGYANWSMLMKHRLPLGKSNAKQPVVFSRTEAELRETLRMVPQPRFGSRQDVAKERVADICADFDSAANAADFAISYMQAVLALPRYLVSPSSQVFWEMRQWLPYGAHALADGNRILVNRKYKPVGQAGDDFANYEEFTQLHLTLTSAQVQQVSARVGSDGFLFNDGCPPWRSRVYAEGYLGRLRELRLVIGN